ncbi:54S ribosomal protein L38, mitochondrial [Maublancomyces gigas]|uniref:54S ribosomal protein L38, mitochondrial n=1 Tax=Discina gigas TaxID=1032678 RepID=A0ABR3GIH9_9PEZI
MFPSRVLGMVQLKSMLTCIDNSGAALVECVMVLKRKKPAGIGDKIVVVIQKQRSLGQDLSATAQAAVKVRRGDVCHAVVVRTKKKYSRPDGSYIRFDDNACVLVNKAGDPLGTRLSGVVGEELKRKNWSKILSLAPMNV